MQKTNIKRQFDKTPVSIGDHIRKRRLELGLLQKDVAKRIKVTEDCITNWENNRSEPMIHYLPAIIQFLGYSPQTFDVKNLGDRIREYRYRKGLSFAAFGKMLRVDGSTISSWEKSQSIPSQRNIGMLKNKLHIIK